MIDKILVIAKREYVATVKTKIFLISILLAPVLITGFAMLQLFLELSSQDQDHTIVVCDGTNTLFDSLAEKAKQGGTNILRKELGLDGNGPNYVLKRCEADTVTDEVRLAYSAQILAGDLDAFVEIEPAVLTRTEKTPEGKVVFFSENAVFSKELRWFRSTLDRAVRNHRIHSLGLDPAEIRKVMRPVRIEALKPYTKTATGEVKRSDESLSLIAPVLPFAAVMMILFSIMVLAGPLLQSIIEEKQQHIIEVLLGSVRPFELMVGKLLGNTAIALTLLGIYLLGGYILAIYFVYTDLFSVSILLWFTIFELLALLMYGSVFISLGAACNELKDTQILMTPVMIVVVFPVMMISEVVGNPSGGLAVGLSFFPLTAPFAMIARLTATAAIPAWQPLLSALIVVITAAVFITGAGRIFRIGVLAQGKTPGLRQILRWALGKH